MVKNSHYDALMDQTIDVAVKMHKKAIFIAMSEHVGYNMQKERSNSHTARIEKKPRVKVWETGFIPFA